MSLNNNLTIAYKKRLFEKNKNIIPKDDFPWFYLSSFLTADKNINILDAGCGSGKYCEKLSNLGYKNVFGIDLLDENQFIDSTYKYEKSSIDNTKFEDNFFDIIFGNSVIYHLENPQKGIVELNRILKKNGILILTGHTRNSLFTYWRRIKLKLNHKSVGNLKDVHFRKTSEYIDFLKSNGFKILVQDGYFLSFLFYPYYRRKVVGLIQKGIKLPLIKPKFSRMDFCAKFKSNYAYHFVIISRKN